MKPNLIILDLEATGTDFVKHDIIQLGAVKLDSELNIVDSFERLIIPLGNEVSEEAMKVNKLNLDEVRSRGLILDNALQEFEMWIGFPRYYIIGAWGIMFDITFLRHSYKKINRFYPFLYKCFDVASVVRFYCSINNLTSKGGLGKCAKALKVEVEESKKHNALYDAELSAKVLKKVSEYTNHSTLKNGA
jgi:DNA polymerase III alpha subunit (gram-positive type)